MRASVPFLLSLLAPAALAQSDPAARGPHLVRRVDVAVPHRDGSTSTLRVLLPVGAERERPTILLVHGLWVGPGLYDATAEQLASRGYAVALFDQFSRASTDLPGWVAAAKGSIDALARAAVDPGSDLFGELDMDKVGAMGHSFGGMTAIGLAATDPRVKAAVAWAPGATQREQLLRYAATMPDVPTLVMTGRFDAIAIPGTFGRPAYDAIPHRRKLYLQVGMARHGTFCDMPSLTGGAPRQAARRYANAWFDRWLVGADDPAGYTTGRFAANDGSLSDVDAPGPLPSSGTVTTDDLNVRLGPGMSHQVVTTLDAGAQVSILDRRGSWYRVTWSGAPAGELWVHAGYVRT